MEIKQRLSKYLKYSSIALAAITFLALIAYVIFWPDNLMHSDTAAEVIFSNFLAENGGIVSKEWFYSTEIRIIYTQLFMTPLFYIFHSYKLVKIISCIIINAVMVLACLFVSKKLEVKVSNKFLAVALLLAPLSNEYLDMMYLGNFYSCQCIMTYVVIALYFCEFKRNWIKQSILVVLAFVLGLSGLRYLASLYIPLVLMIVCKVLFDTKMDELRSSIIKGAQTIGYLCAAGLGFLVNKFYFATNYTFDQTSSVSFVPLNDVMDRFLNSIKLMLEFVGYREISVVTPLGLVNCVKFVFLIYMIYIVVYLTKHRLEMLKEKQGLLLYFFYACFLINWYMLVFTDVLMQYRYWIPVYIIWVLLAGIYFEQAKPLQPFTRSVVILIAVVTILASLYGELWQDTKYNDCAKRYEYMEFLEDNNYEFGYATFWNSSVTEYLADGQIKVAHLGGKDGVAGPYEWLCPKDYYRKGFHTGKTFLLLARTEEVGMLNGDFTVMPDGEKVYEDEYYVIYEGQDMYLFLEEE